MAWASIINTGIEQNSDMRTEKDGTVSTKKNISQEGINKIIYDVLSSDQGLAALSGGENGSGGFNSATKGLMAQDLAVKLAGEIANITAETTQTNSSVDYQDKTDPLNKFFGGGGGKNAKTIICTYLRDIGMLDPELYKAGIPYFYTCSSRTIIGYHIWATPVVKAMKKHPWLCKFWRPIVQGRYDMIVNKKWNVLGAFTIYILQPLSYLIGLFAGVPNGRYSSAG